MELLRIRIEQFQRSDDLDCSGPVSPLVIFDPHLSQVIRSPVSSKVARVAQIAIAMTGMRPRPGKNSGDTFSLCCYCMQDVRWVLQRNTCSIIYIDKLYISHILE